MHIHPDILALRGDTASQRIAQLAVSEALQAWQHNNRQLLRQLSAFGQGEPLARLPSLRKLTERDGVALRLVEPLVEDLVAVQRKHPLAQLPFRHQAGETFHLLQLARAERATLSLGLHTASSQDAARATFADSERHEVILAGAADIELLELVSDHGPSAAIDCEPRRVVAGETITCAGANVSRVIRSVHRPLLMLRLARQPVCPAPTRQYDIATGRLLHRASGDIRESAQEMMLALLGRMGRSDAASVMARVAEDGSLQIRWLALRECLALDSRAGFRALSAIAADPLDPLATNAGALRAQLLEAHPALNRLQDTVPCPA